MIFSVISGGRYFIVERVLKDGRNAYGVLYSDIKNEVIACVVNL